MERTWLRELRESKGLAQNRVSTIIGIKNSQYRYVELYGGFTDREAMQKIADYFGFDFSKYGEKPPRRSPNTPSPIVGKKTALDHVLNLGKEEKRIYDRIKKRKGIKDFNPILTVTKNGQVSGNYWDIISSIQ